MLPETVRKAATQAGQEQVDTVRMPVPPPAQRGLRCGAQIARRGSLARIGDAGRRFAQRLQQAS
ncbi:MAG: hypothetical protein NZ874_04970 [Fimbriimonadales bacterium]|nr:hypothetical protein [Fimbriimonadales bacterium]